MEQSDCRFNSLPNDMALKIASFLEELCRLDCLWESLFKERWPLSYEVVLEDQGHNLEGWRGFYIAQRKAMPGIAAYVVSLVEKCSLSKSIDFNDFLKAVKCMESLPFGFKDVQLFFFKPKLNVLHNLVGLHYCLSFLKVPASDVMKALQISGISDRQFHVNWLMLVGVLFNGLHMPVESHSRRISLEDLATSKDKKMLGVFDQESIRKAYSIRISSANL